MIRRLLRMHHSTLQSFIYGQRLGSIRGIYEGVIRDAGDGAVTIISEQDTEPCQEKGLSTAGRVSEGVPHEDDEFISGLRQSAGAGMWRAV